MDAKGALSINFETPYMAVDLSQTRKNIQKFQDMANRGNKILRPHSKTHKIPFLARLQVDAGAVGVCVQKVAEAEVMYTGGVSDILLSNEIVDTRKCDRVARLSASGCRISVAVDSLEGASTLSESAAYLRQVIPVLIDVNVGMDRCGVDPDEVLEFHSQLKAIPNIRVEGIMAYDGQVHSSNPLEREEMVNFERKLVQELFDKLKKIDSNIKVLTVGGTPSSGIWSHFEEVTEIQPGTYVFYDIHSKEMGLCSMDEISMGIVGQVMSMKDDERIVLDSGYKSISLDQGVYPVALNEKGIVGKVQAMSEEHTVIKPEQEGLGLGSKVLLLPYHSCTTTDLWDYAWLYEDNELPVRTKIMGRGKRE